MIESISAQTDGMQCLDADIVVARLNRKLAGWANYFASVLSVNRPGQSRTRHAAAQPVVVWGRVPRCALQRNVGVRAIDFGALRVVGGIGCHRRGGLRGTLRCFELGD